MATEEQQHDAYWTFVAKAVAIFVLGLGSFVSGVLPGKIAQWWRSNASRSSPGAPRRPGHQHRHAGDSATDFMVISLLLCFGGGVLLFTTLLHLMPEARKSVDALRQAGRLPDGGVENLADVVFCMGFFMACAVDEMTHTVLMWYNERMRRRHHYGIPASASPEMATYIPSNGQDRGDSALHGLFTVVALSFHEVFEGLALGLERRPQNAWYLLAAVASHKLIIAFCIGLELAWSNTRWALYLVYVGIFAAVTPVGIVFGMALNNVGESDVDGLASPGPVAVLLQALAAGTLLYAVFFEVLARHKESGWPHLLAVMVGFSMMAVVQQMTHNHDHDHDAHQDHHVNYHIHNH